jgi:hypothetical protein
MGSPTAGAASGFTVFTNKDYAQTPGAATGAIGGAASSAALTIAAADRDCDAVGCGV